MSIAAVLKKIKDDKAEGYKLVDRIGKFLGGDSKAVGAPNIDTLFRASSLTRLCPREEVICGLMGIERKDKFDGMPGLKVIFGIGDGLHWWIQNKVLGPMGVLVGCWRCNRCGKIYGEEERVPLPARCSNVECQGERDPGEDWEYVEAYVENRQFMASGHPDGFLRFAVDDIDWLLEFKTINEKGFFALKEAKPEHIEQVRIYLWLTGLRKAVIVYLNKNGFIWDSLWRFFEVEQDDAFIDALKGKLVAVKKGLIGGKLPDGICINDKCKRAKECQVVSLCFDKNVDQLVELRRSDGRDT